jgi:hypothetical protein
MNEPTSSSMVKLSAQRVIALATAAHAVALAHKSDHKEFVSRALLVAAREVGSSGHVWVSVVDLVMISK